MESHPLTQDEVIDEPVGRYAPRLGQTRRKACSRHRLHEGIVECVERRRENHRFARVEPGRYEHRLLGPCDLPFWAGGMQRSGDKNEEHSEKQCMSAHGRPFSVATAPAATGGDQPSAIPSHTYAFALSASPFSSQDVIPISRYIVVAVARCSCVCARWPVC